MKTYEEVVTELDSKIPRDAVSTRSGGGQTLSYLAGHYVIDRLNKVLGQGNWEAITEEMTKLHEGIVEQRSGNTNYVSYRAKVALRVTFPNGKQAIFAGYGFGDGTDKTNPGKAHELAIKEAETDGLKRGAKNLGMSMGLALYSKDQENVDDAEPETKPVSSDGPVKTSIGAVDAKPSKPDGTKAVPSKSTGATRDQVLALISAKARVILDKKIKTKEQVIEMMKSKFKVSEKEKLTDEQAAQFADDLNYVLNPPQEASA